MKPPHVLRPVTADVDVPLPRKDGPVAVGSSHNVISARDLGILPVTVRPMHIIELDPNGLPIRVRDPSRDSSQDSRPAKDKASDTKSLN